MNKIYTMGQDGRIPQARDRDHGCDIGSPQTLSVGEHEAIAGAAFDHRGRCDFRRADYVAD